MAPYCSLHFNSLVVVVGGGPVPRRFSARAARAALGIAGRPARLSLKEGGARALTEGARSPCCARAAAGAAARCWPARSWLKARAERAAATRRRSHTCARSLWSSLAPAPRRAAPLATRSERAAVAWMWARGSPSSGCSWVVPRRCLVGACCCVPRRRLSAWSSAARRRGGPGARRPHRPRSQTATAAPPMERAGRSSPTAALHRLLLWRDRRYGVGRRSAGRPRARSSPGPRTGAVPRALGHEHDDVVFAVPTRSRGGSRHRALAFPRRRRAAAPRRSAARRVPARAADVGAEPRASAVDCAPLAVAET